MVEMFMVRTGSESFLQILSNFWSFAQLDVIRNLYFFVLLHKIEELEQQQTWSHWVTSIQQTGVA